MSPTARTLKHLRSLGFLCAVVERWNMAVGIRQDLFGFADILGVHARDRIFLLVNATSLSNVASRVRKIRQAPEARTWLRAGGRAEVWGWSKRDNRWVPRIVPVTDADLDTQPRPARGRRRPRQKELF